MSFARAVQTGHWHQWDPRPRDEPEHRFDIIDALFRELEELERGWERWFEQEGVEPLELGYEDVVADPEGETKRVLGFLSLSTDVEVRPLTAGRPVAVDDWGARYRTELMARQRP